MTLEFSDSNNYNKNEHIVVDLIPGIYEMNWLPHEPYKIYSEKANITILPGETKKFSCDMKPKGAGSFFGAIGVVASDYIHTGYLAEKTYKTENIPVFYLKYKKP